MISYCRHIDDVGDADLAEVGGKAVGCARLLRLGLRVPTGFVVTTRAFELLLDNSGLAARRDQVVATFARGADRETLQRECESLQEAIRAASLPAEVEVAIASALEHLVGSVAVRSSAVAEDSPETSFAGVFHSELHVTQKDIWPAILDCWARSLSYSALHHALAHGVDPKRLAVALVIQEMVAAKRAGAVFSRDPSGAHPEHAVIAVADGTAEALMDGQVGGDAVVVARNGKGVDDPLHKELLRAACLVEKKLGRPQDMEWALAGDHVYFLQTRPITTLELEPGQQIIWTRELTEERYPQPVSPLGWSALQGVLEVNLETLAKRFGLVARQRDHVARTIRHHVYTNERFFSIPGSLRPNPLAHLRFFPGYLRQAMTGLLWDLPRALRGPLGGKWVLYRRLFEAAIFPHAREIDEFWKGNLTPLIAEMDAFTELSFAEMSDDEIFASHRQIEAVAKRYMEPDLAIYVVKTACEWLVKKLGEELLGDGQTFLTDITGGLDDNCTLQMNIEMAELGDAIRADDAIREHLVAGRFDEILAALDGDLAERFDAFVQRNGHLTTNWDLREATWGEEPTKVLQMLRGHAISTKRRDFREIQAQRKERYQAAHQAAHEAMSGSRWFVEFFDTLVRTLHSFMLIDEEHHFYCSRLFKPMRSLLDELGRRMVDRQLIGSRDDIYFLELDEIRRALAEEQPFTRRYLVAARQMSFQRSASARPPNRFRDNAPIFEERPLLVSGNDLPGTGASPGIASGTVRIVETPSDVSAFVPGEVLVTPSPNPAWTPIYSVASAMVTSTGSILSHGLVSAREYALPAVIGIEDVTRRLKTGQKVTVNGDLGIVSIDAD